MPVGRLDFMTEGLLLLTNDGELKRQLELPKTRVICTYRARAFGQIANSTRAAGRGRDHRGIRYGSINANLERRTGSNCWIELSLTEGKPGGPPSARAFGTSGLATYQDRLWPFSLDELEPGGMTRSTLASLTSFRKTLP